MEQLVCGIATGRDIIEKINEIITGEATYDDTEIWNAVNLNTEKRTYPVDDEEKLAGIQENANNYSLPVASGTILGGVKQGTNITIDVDGVISASGGESYILPTASSTVKGGIEIFSDTVQTVASNAVSATASRTYGVQLDSEGRAVVNVPWSDTDTTYTNANIKSMYEANSNTNAFTDAEQSKLSGIEVGAEENNISDVDATDLTDGGDTTLHYHTSDRNRENHAGTQAISTVSGLQTALDGKSATSHNHSGVYEPADGTILKEADIGVTVQAYDTNNATTDTAQTFTAPQRTSIAVEDNTIDFSLANNFNVTATAAVMSATNLVAGQSGVILIDQATNITGWGLEMFVDAPPEMFDYEIFAYFVIDDSTVFMGRVQ